MLGWRLIVTLSVLAVHIVLTYGFYIPGVAPAEFHDGDDVVVKVSIKLMQCYSCYKLQCDLSSKYVSKCMTTSS